MATISELRRPVQISPILEPGHSCALGLTQTFYAPAQFYQAARQLPADIRHRDWEAIKDDLSIMTRTPIVFTYSLGDICTYLIGFNLIKATLLTHKITSVVTPIIGLIASVFEGISESYFLYRTVTFLKHFKWRNEHTPENLRSDIQVLNRFLHPKANMSERELEIRRSKLARRVSPWLAEQIANNIKGIASNLNSADETLRSRGTHNAKELLLTIERQCHTRMMVHIIGLIAIVGSIICFSLALAGVPAATMVILLILAGVAGWARYGLAQGYLNSPDGTFQWKSFFPTFLQKKIEQALTCSTNSTI